jgi:hypothetical protein
MCAGPITPPPAPDTRMAAPRSFMPAAGAWYTAGTLAAPPLPTGSDSGRPTLETEHTADANIGPRVAHLCMCAGRIHWPLWLAVSHCGGFQACRNWSRTRGPVFQSDLSANNARRVHAARRSLRTTGPRACFPSAFHGARCQPYSGLSLQRPRHWSALCESRALVLSRRVAAATRVLFLRVVRPGLRAVQRSLQHSGCRARHL